MQKKSLNKWRQEELEARREREKKETWWWRGRLGHGDVLLQLFHIGRLELNTDYLQMCCLIKIWEVGCNLRVHMIYTYQQTESWERAVRQLGRIMHTTTCTAYHDGLLFLVSFTDPLSLTNLWAVFSLYVFPIDFSLRQPWHLAAQ